MIWVLISLLAVLFVCVLDIHLGAIGFALWLWFMPLFGIGESYFKRFRR
jgi:hypothetical protein